jgi:hypothetical protein
VHVKRLPATDDSLVLRTDFSTDSGWESVCEAISTPVGEFQAQLSCVSDPAFDGLTIERLLKLKHGDHGYVFIVDHDTLAGPEKPVLVVDLEDDPGRRFRVVPSQMWSVENNLSLANMDFSEFAERVDEDGVFRGFTRAT